MNGIASKSSAASSEECRIFSNPSKFRNSVSISAAVRPGKSALPRFQAYESGGRPCLLIVHPRRILRCHCRDIALAAFLDTPFGMPMNRRYVESIRVFLVISHKCGSLAHWPSQRRRQYASASAGPFTSLIWCVFQSQHAFFCNPKNPHMVVKISFH